MEDRDVAGMAYELAKLHIDDLLREAEQERLAKQAAAGRRAGLDPVDAVGFRERLSRLISALPVVPSGPRPAGA
jgi:hypothetical protein